MASGLNTSWKIDGETWKQWQTLFSCAPISLWMVTAAMKLKDACSLEENLDSILKRRNITLLTNACMVKAMLFPVVMYGCESWSIKTAECQRIDAFELWCRRRLLRVPWTARRSNKSILKEISPEYSMEGLMLKLKLQYFGHLMQRTGSLDKTLMLGKIEGRRRRGWRGWDGWMASPTWWTWVWVGSRSWWWTGSSDVLQSMGSRRVRLKKPLNWTELWQLDHREGWVPKNWCFQAVVSEKTLKCPLDDSKEIKAVNPKGN